MDSSEQPKKRQKKTWKRIDTGGKTVQEYIHSIIDKICYSSEMSGKKYYKCKYHKSFECKHTIRTFMIGDEEFTEESDEHVCNDKTLEKRLRGLPKHVKEEVEKQLKLRPNVTPRKLFEELMIKETDKNLFTVKHIRNVMITWRKKNKEVENFYRNTVEGIKLWSKRHYSIKHAKDIVDDDKIIVAKLCISPNK